ncbi:alpha/beta hydrolase [Bacillus coagulans]|uniref:conserved phage C-terminal domain-containing protein n=1 Tax=Heyndrickxia coagulans TaxID=1398 RepID=UPI001377B830|nr:conserved phage C-terminal domain-containing protein [Heyndrickxia coagulans]NCG67778.1 alpha/beta hydrolase [Heyndrickxia coagulans]
MHRNYYAIIPANVRYDKDLNQGAKLLYGEITALSNEKGYCWAGNGYFAELYGKGKSTIARWIQQLEDKGYITREIIYKKGSHEIESRHIKIRNENAPTLKNENTPTLKNENTPTLKNENTPTLKNENTPTLKNEIDNNTFINNTNNNIPYVEIVTYLNRMANTNYRSTTKATQRAIKARWNEGFRLEDFKKVIDIKTKEWLSDPKMCKYLRPETLFGTKFESYLNQQHVGNTNDLPKRPKVFEYDINAGED